MSRTEWARAHHMDARSLNAWRLNLERAAEQDAGLGETLRLVELLPQDAVDSAPTYRVRRGELVVEVEDNFDDDVLRRLLGVVLSC